MYATNELPGMGGAWVIVCDDGDVYREKGQIVYFPDAAAANALIPDSQRPRGLRSGPLLVLYVSGYTPLYEPYTRRLEATLHALGRHYRITAYEDRGTWLKNLSIKPDTVLAGFTDKDYPNHDVLWLDADCLLTQPWPEIDADVAYYQGSPPSPRRFDFKLKRVVSNTERLDTPAGMVLYFRNCPEVVALVDTWQRLCGQFGELTNDEQCLREALTRHPQLRVVQMRRLRAVQHGGEGYKAGKPPEGGV